MSNPNPPNPEQAIQQAIEQSKQTPGAMPLEVKLATGQVYKAETPQELLNKVVAAQEEASRTIQVERQQREQLQQQMAEMQKQIPPPPADASQAEKDAYYMTWAQDPRAALTQQIAKEMGISPDKVWPTLKRAVEGSVATTAADEFLGRYPGFVQTPQNVALIKEGLRQRFGESMEQTTADNLELVYNGLVRAGRIDPASMPASGMNQPYTAVANLRGQQAPPNPVNGILQDFAALPLDKMKETIDRLAASGVLAK